jgi:hypothetical protein
MLEIFGKQYYIDIDRITEECQIEEDQQIIKNNIEAESSSTENGTQIINIFKYEMLKMFIERVLNENIEDDESIGVFASDATTLSFKIAFNTLIKNKILIENEDE